MVSENNTTMHNSIETTTRDEFNVKPKYFKQDKRGIIKSFDAQKQIKKMKDIQGLILNAKKSSSFAAKQAREIDQRN